MTVSVPGVATSMDIDVCLDTGAGLSLIDGQIALSLGLDLYAGTAIPLSTATGMRFEARLHRVVLQHETLGRFEFEVGFTTSDLYRNLLGRDFMNFVQVGFRENQLTFYVTPKP